MPRELHPAPNDPSSLAAAGVLSRYREATTSAYRTDPHCFWSWCADQELAPLPARRSHLELYLRDLQDKGYAAATVSRRLSTVAGLFRYAVIDEATPRWRSPDPRCSGRARSGPCCTRWRSPPS